MIVHLPDDGFTVLATLLSSRYLFVVPVVYGPILWGSYYETDSVFRTSGGVLRSPWLLLTLVVSWCLAEIIVAGSSILNWGSTAILFRDAFVVLVGGFAPLLLLNPAGERRRSILGRLHPPARLLNLGFVAFLGLGLFFWGVSFVRPFGVSVGHFPATFGRAILQGSERILMIPFLEEVIFRALIYPIFRSFLTPWGGILSVSLLFSGLHGLQAGFLFRFAGSVLATFLFEITGSILPGFVLHAGFNVLIFYGASLVS